IIDRQPAGAHAKCAGVQTLSICSTNHAWVNVRRPTAACAGDFTGMHSIPYRKAPMNGPGSYCRYAAQLALVVLAVWVAGCSGSRGPILGTGADAQLSPTVTATTPVDLATGVVVAGPVI